MHTYTLDRSALLKVNNCPINGLFSASILFALSATDQPDTADHDFLLDALICVPWESVNSPSRIWLHTVLAASSSSFKMWASPMLGLYSLWSYALTSMQATPTRSSQANCSVVPSRKVISASCYNIIDNLPKMNSLSFPKSHFTSVIMSPCLFIKYSSGHLVPKLWICLWWFFFASMDKKVWTLISPSSKMSLVTTSVFLFLLPLPQWKHLSLSSRAKQAQTSGLPERSFFPQSAHIQPPDSLPRTFLSMSLLCLKTFNDSLVPRR